MGLVEKKEMKKNMNPISFYFFTNLHKNEWSTFLTKSN